MFDSVFSTFTEHTEHEEIPYQDDEPILGFDEINETLDEAEAYWTNLILATSWTAVDKLLARLSEPLGKLDLKAIDKQLKDFSIAGTVQALLMSAWQEILKTGSEAGIIEVNETNQVDREEKSNRKKVLFAHGARLAEFARKPSFEIAYPPAHADASLIEVEELREALNLRTQLLADDISEDLNERISNVIRESVVEHSTATRRPSGTITGLSKSARTKLVRKINGAIGRERQRLKEQGVPESSWPRTKIKIPDNKLLFQPAPGDKPAYVKRANTIASTELNAGYNLGRLQAYAKRKVKYVRWQAIGDIRTCSLCRSRNGTILSMKTVLTSGLTTARSKNRQVKYNKFQFVLPAHPNCRCAWQVATKAELKDKVRRETKPVPLGAAWATVGASAALIGGIRRGTSIAQTAEEIAMELEQEERSKRKARRRAILAAGGALSLGWLGLGLWTWINRSSQTTTPSKLEQARVIARELIGEDAQRRHITRQRESVQIDAFLALEARKKELDSQKIEARRYLPSDWTERYPDLAWADTRDYTDTTLKTRFGLTPGRVKQLRAMQNNYLKSLYIPLYEKVLPGSVVSDLDLIRYPWLADIEDIRELTPKDISKRIPGDDRRAAKRQAFVLHRRILKKLRQRGLGFSAKSEGEKRAVEAINQAKSVRELRRVFNVGERQGAILRQIFEYKQNKNGQIHSLYELIDEVDGLGYKTITTAIARMTGKKINLVRLMSENDRATAEAILEDKLLGVGKVKVSQIYDALKHLGDTPILDNSDLVKFLRSKGVKISEGGNLQRALQDNIELDWQIIPGAELQIPKEAKDWEFPNLPGSVQPRSGLPKQ